MNDYDKMIKKLAHTEASLTQLSLATGAYKLKPPTPDVVAQLEQEGVLKTNARNARRNYGSYR